MEGGHILYRALGVHPSSQMAHTWYSDGGVGDYNRLLYEEQVIVMWDEEPIEKPSLRLSSTYISYCGSPSLTTISPGVAEIHFSTFVNNAIDCFIFKPKVFLAISNSRTEMQGRLQSTTALTTNGPVHSKRWNWVVQMITTAFLTPIARWS